MQINRLPARAVARRHGPDDEPSPVMRGCDPQEHAPCPHRLRYRPTLAPCMPRTCRAKL